MNAKTLTQLTPISDTSQLLHNLVLQQGDHGSELLSIVEHYIQQCCRTYYSITYEERKDIAQEASIKLLLNYEDIKHSISKRWLYVMVKNLCLDALRKQRKSNQLNHSTVDEDTKQQIQITPEDFESYSFFEQHQCLDNVFAYIEAQPTGENDLTVYSHFAYGVSLADIAQMTGRTVGAVTKRISILRSRLKTLRAELC